MTGNPHTIGAVHPIWVERNVRCDYCGQHGPMKIVSQNVKGTGHNMVRCSCGLKFFDPRLSGTGKTSCSSCHLPEHAFTDQRAQSPKDNGKLNSRNSPTMYNVGYLTELYWDGRDAAGAEVASGVYFTKLQLAGSVTTRKMLLLR